MKHEPKPSPQPNPFPGHVFKDERTGRLYMVRCPRCTRENYSGSVSSGRCAWCGEEAREEHVRPKQ